MSLYGSHVVKGVKRFVTQNHVQAEFMTSVPDSIERGDTFLLLNSQLDAGLVALAHKIQQAGLVIGQDVFIISYNESDMNELVLGGLTTVSTDFREMGRLAADMVLTHQLEKVHCPFHMNRRRTF
jgi:DNA-binding LacI/PurR family transcriptional regulator